MVRWKQRQKLFIDILITFPHFTRTAIQTNHQVQGESHDREYHDEKNPWHFDRRSDWRCIHIQNNDQPQYSRTQVDRLCITIESCKQQQNKYHFQQNTHNRKNKSCNTIFRLCSAFKRRVFHKFHSLFPGIFLL